MAYLPSRFIPTGAGNTCQPLSTTFGQLVHPHGCGEHAPGPWCTAGPCGSSPRVRGTPSRTSMFLRCSRFIPTGAGNTVSLHGSYRSQSVHPHGCGEHDNWYGGTGNLSGSSPRVRGTHRRDGDHAGVCRFIPTGAGNTKQPARPTAGRAVHPHGCGEHTTRREHMMHTHGSSPRVRGTRL